MARAAKKKKKTGEHGETLRRELRSILYFLAALLLGLSLFSYDPKDSVWLLKAGGSPEVGNLFGTVGASLSGWIFQALGFAAFWFVVFFLVSAILAFQERNVGSPLKKGVSTIFLVLSFAGLLALAMPGEVRYQGVGVVAGGLAGKTITTSLRPLLNGFGTGVLLLFVFVVSLMICTHLSFRFLFSKLGIWLRVMYRRCGDLLTKWKERRRKKKALEGAVKREKARTRPRVTIVEPKKPVKTPAPEQESFPFMRRSGSFQIPPLSLLEEREGQPGTEVQRGALEMNARRLEKKLADFGVTGEVAEILPGPVITMYELKPAPGVKISKVAGLSDDLAMALRAPSIRIVAPLPGKGAIGIEIPNNRREFVYLKDLLGSREFRDTHHKLPIALGKDTTGSPVVADLTRMPHLLVAGATGTGKSVSLNAMINSLLFKVSPDQVRFLMVDPKRIELSIYKDIPHLLHPVVTEPKEATRVLKWAVEEMERRYMLLSDRGVRNIEAYNRKALTQKKTPDEERALGKDRPLPYIILIIDELADLMMTSSRDVEEAITRLAQMARAAGLHLVIATQRPSVDVLTGIIKANFPARVSFQVSSKVDSRTILDTVGAEHLLGDGDMLFLPPSVGKLMRIHGAYISEEEVKGVTDFLREQMKPDYDESIKQHVTREEDEEEEVFEKDEKYDKAVEVVLQTGQASISMIQRKLRVGYNRAARMIDAMEREGIVGPSDGIKPRDVYGRREG